MTTKTLPPDAAGAAPKLSELTPEQRALLMLRMRQKAARQEETAGVSPIRPVPRDPGAEIPLSFSQQRLWFMDRWQPGSAAYNIPAALRLTGRLNVAALRWSVSEIVRRHESLRTAFSPERPAQIVREVGTLSVPVVDLEPLPGEARTSELARLAGEDAARPFDLSRAPLLRVTLVRTAPEEHAILLNMHHIVSDGWSMGVLVREFVTLYEARLRGVPSPLPELPIQYPDFAAWQREKLGGAALEEELSWWRRTLEGAPAVVSLPLARPCPASRSGKGFQIPFGLSEETTRALAALARREGATLFMALLAAFNALLSRFSGEEDLVVGTAVAGRNRAELEGMIGFFVNSLALRSDLSGDPTFRELLARAREVTVGAQGHQDVPFEKLVEELRPERDTSHPPIFQAVMTLENTPRSAAEIAGLSLAPLESPSGTARYDLTLSAMEVEGRLEGFLEASRDLYDEISARRVLASFEVLLAGVLADPDQRLSELPLVPEAERWQIQGEWNDAALSRPRGSFHKVFEERVGAWEDRTAVASGDESLTYGELNRRANQLAHHLRSLGVGPEVLVGLSLPRSVDMAVAVLGIWKAGGAYVPLDPTYPMERLAGMMEETLLPVIVTQESVLDRLPTHFGFVVRLDEDWDWIASSPDHDPEGGADPGNLAYAIFTSGSTGKPKGVLVEHAGVLNMAFAQSSVANASPGDPFLLVAPLAFDAAVFDLVMALFAGGTLWIARQDELLGPELARLLAEREIASLTITPSALSSLPISGEDLPALRRLWVAGEACPPELVARWAPGRRFFNAYGPTETTVWATVEEVAEIGTPPIGRPVANKTAYVLDARMRPVPAGVVGELFVGGEGTARGYLGRPDLTAERFVPDPFGGVPGERLYKTGDLVRQALDGRLEFVGRNDQQVKIRGFRIELGEIENALAEHRSVREAVVVVREERGDRRLAAFVTGEASEDLKAHLTERLPAYMVPTSITLLPALPLTPNGKVDRRVLAAMETEAAASGRVWVAPRTPLEELLAGAMAGVLGVERVGLRDSFFDLGGHSLLATQVLSRVREALDVEIPLAAFFEHPTVEGLAELAGRNVPSVAPPLVPEPRDEHPPLSFAQQRLWFIQRLDPAGTAYNIPGAVRLVGALDVPAFARSLGEIVRRHEVLRTAFPEVDGRPFQAVSPWTPPALPVLDLSALPNSVKDGEVERLALEMARRPFDLARGPLLRLALVRLGEEEHAALFTFHHIIFDGWSMGVLVGELAALYTASPLPEPAVQYADFSRWQRDWLSGDVLAEQVSWWKERLVGAPTTLDLPTDHPRPASPSGRGRRTPFALGADLSRELQSLSRSRGTTLFMTLLAGVQTLLSRLSGQTDVSVGTPIAGRNRLETEGLLGFFVNTLVLRAGLADRPTFADLLARAREMALGAYAHQDVPFELLVEELQPDRALSYAPLFQVIFALQNTPAAGLALPGLTLESVDLEPGSARIDLSLELVETPDGLTGWAEHSTDLFDEATIERWTGHLRTLLAAACAEPETRVSELPLLSEAERQQIAEWSGARGDFGKVLVHHLFEEQARRNPERIALVDGDRTLSYRELDAEAERLAERLRGIGAETRVGVKIPRSAEMVIAFLGILKAGGVYVPLDPAYPAERLAAMVEEAGVEVVIEASPRPGPHPPAPSPATPPPSPGEGEQNNVFAVLPLSQGGGMGWWERGPGGEGWAGEGSEGGAPSLAYVMFTSGSTGRPKAVGVEHRGIVRLVRGADYADLGPDQVFLQLAPAAFDASTLEIWAPLLNGGRLVIFRGEASALPELGETIAQHGVTTLWLTAGLFHQVVDHGIEILRPVRQLLAGGDVLSPAHVNRVLAEVPGCRVINGYGPTENTTFTCCYPVPGPIPPGRTVPVGRPIAGTTVHVVDREFQPVPVGVPGELLTGGDGLARGYLNRPDLTAERFVPGSFGERLYRTGDLARWRPDGTVEFLGRLDDQVKIRGFRIEPGEVETVVARHPDVRQAAVVVAEGAGGKRLVAYVAGDVSADDLRFWLRERLPEHMVPSAVVLLPELPLTPNGKVDRKALPAPEAGVPERAVLSAPRTPVEEILASIWAEVLGVERVGIEDGFFDLGGHSLSAIQVISRVRGAFGVELPLRLLFEEPTPAGLAPHVEEALRARAGTLAPPIVPVPRGGEIPLSFAQERLWFLEQLQPGTAAYNMGMAVEMEGALDVATLESGLLRIVARHEALRTRFPTVDGRPVQEIAPPPARLLPVVDLSALPDEIRHETVARLSEEEALRPFDLTTGPLLRAALLRLSETEHVALLSMHHIVSDGWSMDVLVREMATAYTGGALPDLPVQYADFADWQRRWLRGEVLEAELGFWRDRLAGAPAVTALPLDRPRPPVQRFEGDRFLATPDADLAAAVRALARRAGATSFMVLLAAFHGLLARLTGETDLVAGVPTANRNRQEIEGLIGFFVNTLALRSDLSEDPDARTLLGRVRESTLAAYAHQDLPFEKLVAEIAPQRDLSTTPLFQVLFQLQSAASRQLDLPGLALRFPELETGTAKFDLVLTFVETPEGISAEWRYATALFDGTTVRRLAGQFQRLLRGMAAAPERSLSELPLLSEGELHQVTAEWNAPFLETVPDITELFDARAKETPETVALSFEGTDWTYADLARKAEEIARSLREEGVGMDSIVPVTLKRGPEYIATVLGVLKAGGGWLPLDPAHPEKRREEILERVGCAVRTGRAVESNTCAQRTLRQDALAYVLFTSGSTGLPKGVLVPRRGMANHIQAKIADLQLTSGDIVAQTASQSFDIHVWQCLAALAVGGRVQVFPDEVVRDPVLLAEAVERDGVTILEMVPSLLGVLLDALESGERPAFRSLRWLIPTGEALPPELARRWLALYPEIPLLNAYGPTEASDRVSHHPISTPPPRGMAITPIGRPIPGLRLHVLDGALRPLPIGAPGELYIGGAGVGRGYLHDPVRTAEVFLPDPFGEPGARLYRTGDLARFLADGTLEYLGRRDHQVKIRGVRIETGEIEAALRQSPGVREAAVVARDEPKRLVAYFVPSEAGLDVAALRAFLKERLPEAMIPAAFVEMAAFPRTPNGKLDRRALPAPAAGESRAATQGRPYTALEALVAEAWREVLGDVPVGVEDSFFELGGDSIKGAILVNRLQKKLGQRISVADLFGAPTVAGLAAKLEKGSAETAPPLIHQDISGPAPLSFTQERLWFLQQLDPGTGAYNMPLAFRLRGALDVPALAEAFREIARRHETLRTRYELREGGPVAVVDPEPQTALPVADLSALPAILRDEEARRLIARESYRAFDLAHGPVFRTLLLRLSGEDHAVLFATHHIAGDGWSLGLWAGEVEALYQRKALPDLPVQYADFARWQRLQEGALERQVGYWRTRLAGSPPFLELPADHPRPPVQTFRGEAVSLGLPGDLVLRLRSLGSRHDASLFMTLLAGFQLLLARLSGQRDVPVGSPIAGRTRPEVEGLIGCFLNTLVLRTDLAGNPPFAELLGRVRETALGAFAHQDVPFEKVLEELAPERDLSRSSLFQVMFNMLNAPASQISLPGLTLQGLALPEVLAKFDLTLYVAEQEEGLALELVYNADLFGLPRMEEMLRQYRGLLAQAVDDPGAGIETFSLLTREAAAVLPDPAVALGEEWVGAVHDLFSEQARTTPDHLAVADRDGAWTYGALDAEVRRIAGSLIAEGVQPGDRVAVYAHRSAPFVASILGVLKAGAAYVVLDPAYPEARLSEIVRLAEPRAVIRPDLPTGPVADAWPVVGPADLACISFTSGSTGTPKGILQTHGSMSHFLPWQKETFGFGAGDRFTLLSGLAHDPLQRDLFHALCLGASLHAPDPDRIGEPGYLARWMRSEGITVAHLTPAMAQLLTEGAAEELPDLRLIVLGGDLLTRRDVARLRRLAPRVEIVNVYGSTESHRALAWHRVGEGEDRPKQTIPLGRGMRDVQLLVLNQDGALAGVGELGEVVIRSPHLAAGYLGGERFTGQVRTGDLGRYLPNGEVEAAGRADQQVKIRGFRVEPGEIEAELGRIAGVREAVVVAREDGKGERRLVAYVVLDGEIPVSALRESLREKLPAYMVPAAFVILDRLPLNPNGKVDRRALPDPGEVESTPAGERIAPRDEMERRLAKIWEEILETSPVGVKDDFFDLGGHSLLAVRLAARIEHELGRSLPLAVLFQHSTIEELAGLLRGEEEAAVSALVPLKTGGALPPLFLVHPAGGQILCYTGLVPHLGEERPIYALQDVVAEQSLSGLAAAYLREVQSVQPVGPYHLAGWSFGGRVAFEMARQLREAGQEVAFLGMLDTGLVIPPAEAEKDDAALLLEVVGDVPMDLDELRQSADPVAALVERAREAGLLPPDFAPAAARRILDLVKSHLRIARTDRPQPYAGRVTFFSAAEQPLEAGDDPAHGWGEVAGEIEVHRVPGSHTTMIYDAENVRVLGRKIREAVLEVLGAPSAREFIAGRGEGGALAP